MRATILFLVAVGGVAVAAPPIHVGYDAAHLDLDHHTLQFKPSRAVSDATITAIGEDGSEIGRGAVTYDHPSADPWWSITWTPSSDARVLKLELRVSAADGAATNVELIPWSATIAHEDVNFATNSAEIAPDQRAKLDASLAAITAIIKTVAPHMAVTLYIAGHTDTVGGSAANRTLSRARAHAIGQYFHDHQLGVPIAVAGFGEDVPKVKTPDNTDEPANRRADYVLGPSNGQPPFGGPYLRAKAAWSQLR